MYGKSSLINLLAWNWKTISGNKQIVLSELVVIFYLFASSVHFFRTDRANCHEEEANNVEICRLQTQKKFQFNTRFNLRH